MRDTLPLLEVTDFPVIRRGVTQTLQVNLGYKCNQRCLHCHVNASPDRTEMMDASTLALIPQVLRARGIGTLDLTGGAPELHKGFRALVTAARQQNVHVIDRCNLTILFEPGQDDLAQFLAAQRVEVVASLPCYSVANVDKQRGEGVFDKSIAALQALNALGYGRAGSGLMLNLVFNPQGPSLPPGQASLEADYRRELWDHFGIEFNHLFVLTNMPIKRFGSTLVTRGEFEPYMRLLKDNYQQGNLDQVMCRSLISVDWRGYLYDCDFNQQLDLPMIRPRNTGPGNTGPENISPDNTGVGIFNHGKPRSHVRDLLVGDVANNAIAVADHCFGCTAGQGSSCGGAL